jgi:hypothetical protein
VIGVQMRAHHDIDVIRLAAAGGET